MEARSAAQHGGYLADLHAAHHIDEHCRQPRAGAPAEVAAGQRVTRVRKARRNLSEVGAFSDALARFVGAASLALDLRQARLLADKPEDVRQTEFGLAPR